MGFTYINELATSYIFIVLNTLFVGLRVFTKTAYNRGQFGCDDVIAVVAYILCMGLCGICLAFGYVGNVEEQEAMRLEEGRANATLLSLEKLLFALECIYTFAIMFSKLSILALYQRIFTHGLTVKAIRIMMGVCIANALAYQITILCQCVPFNAVFDTSAHPDGKCMSKQAMSRSASIVGLAIDMPILLLPLPTIYSMNTTMMRKIGILLVFGVGCLGIATCIVRTVIFFSHGIDNDVASSPLIMAGISAIEPSMYMISGCLMTLRPLVARVFSVMVSSYKGNRNTGSRFSAEEHRYFPWSVERVDSEADGNRRDSNLGRIEAIEEEEKGDDGGDQRKESWAEYREMTEERDRASLSTL